MFTTTNPIASFTGNGSTVIFDLDHKYYEDADIVVVLTDALGVHTVQTITTHYTLSGKVTTPTDATTCRVTMVTAPAGGGTPEILTLYRKQDFIQELALGIQDWRNIPMEIQLDKIVMQTQYLKLLLDKTAQFDMANQTTPPSLEELILLSGGSLISDLTAKSSVVAADLFRLGDSADSFTEKKVLASAIAAYVLLAPVLGGALDANSKKIYDILTATLSAEYDNGNSGASKTINWNNGNHQKITLTADCALTFVAPTSGVGHFQLTIIQDSTGSWEITDWGGAYASGGTAPTLTTTPTTGTDVLSVDYNGSIYKVSLIADFLVIP